MIIPNQNDRERSKWEGGRVYWRDVPRNGAG